MIQAHLKDYYLLKINPEDICKAKGISTATFYRYLVKLGMLPRRRYYGLIDTGDKELDARLKDKYAGIVKRCNSRPSYEYKEIYKDMEYMPLYEWVDFCNKHKKMLLNMWDVYIKSDKNPKYAISIDRINNEYGYTVGNLKFVTHGFNSWKRNIRPIKVKCLDGNRKYFMSCEEGSQYYNIRRQTIGDILRGVNRQLAKEFIVEDSTIGEVLRYNSVSSIKEYYEKIFSKEGG